VLLETVVMEHRRFPKRHMQHSQKTNARAQTAKRKTSQPIAKAVS
jgi:hypothetical protein